MADNMEKHFAAGSARMQDVAEKAGVSLSTVSRALRNKDVVDPELSKKIRRISADLGYRRLRRPPLSLEAKRERLGDHRLIGTIGFVGAKSVMDSAHNEASHYHNMLEGIVAAAERRGFHVAASSWEQDDSDTLPSFIAKQKVDGVIFGGSQLAQRFCQNMASFHGNVPMVLLNAKVASLQVNSVIVDNSMMMHMAVEHLAELGHRRIAYFDGKWDECKPENYAVDFHGRERSRFFQEAVQLAGLEYDEDLCLLEPFGEGEHPRVISKIFQRLMNLDRPPTAIIAGLSYALCFFQEALRAGLEIPTDLSLLGIDDSALATAVHPNLTTMSSHFGFGGELAVDLLLSLLAKKEHSSCVRTIRYEPKLIVRKSTGPVK
jgi:DNA-binding LacI/PurR family transcriptional regulator